MNGVIRGYQSFPRHRHFERQSVKFSLAQRSRQRARWPNLAEVTFLISEGLNFDLIGPYVDVDEIGLWLDTL